jgi:hypothetical protein
MLENIRERIVIYSRHYTTFYRKVSQNVVFSPYIWKKNSAILFALPCWIKSAPLVKTGISSIDKVTFPSLSRLNDVTTYVVWQGRKYHKRQ